MKVTSPTPDGEYTLGDSLLIYVIFDKLIMFDPTIKHIIKMLMELSTGDILSTRTLNILSFDEHPLNNHTLSTYTPYHYQNAHGAVDR